MVYEMPAVLPVEMEGSTYIDEHHSPRYSDDKVGETGDGEKEQESMVEQEKGVK